MTPFSLLVDETKRHWNAAGLTLRPGVSDADVNEFQRRYDARLPASLKEYFQTVDGMGANESDDHLFRFWPLSEVRPVAEFENEDPVVYSGFFAFADWSLWAYAYAIRLVEQEPPIVVIVAPAGPIPVAGSFEEFLTMYVQDPESVIGRTST